MKNKIIIISTLLAGLFILNSCLKDEADYWKDDVTGKMYITIASPGLQTKSLLPVADEVTIDFLVNVASDALPKTDVTLSLAFDNEAIIAYDTILRRAAYDSTAIIAGKLSGDTTLDGKPKWKNYKPYPSAVLLTPTITIPAGSRNAYAQIKVDRADTVQLTGFYMRAITITESSIPIAENMKTVLYAFPLANEYEGEYLSEGVRNHPVLGLEPFKYEKLEFKTVNSNTVHKDQVGNYSGYGLDITITDQTMIVAGVTVFKCILKLTPGDGGDPGSSQGVFADYNGEPMNYYNPITRVFELYYYYNSAAPRKIRETDSRL